MEQPPGFEDHIYSDYVCELQRLLYGLKQLPRQWNKEIHQALVSLGLSHSKYDPTLYLQLRNNHLVEAISTHVDDVSVVGEPSFVSDIIFQLGKLFTIGAGEELHHFLSMEISRNVKNQFLFLSQAHYINDVEQRFLGTSHISCSNPTDSLFKTLSPREPEEPPSPGPYP